MDMRVNLLTEAAFNVRPINFMYASLILKVVFIRHLLLYLPARFSCNELTSVIFTGHCGENCILQQAGGDGNCLFSL